MAAELGQILRCHTRAVDDWDPGLKATSCNDAIQPPDGRCFLRFDKPIFGAGCTGRKSVGAGVEDRFFAAAEVFD